MCATIHYDIVSMEQGTNPELLKCSSHPRSWYWATLCLHTSGTLTYTHTPAATLIMSWKTDLMPWLYIHLMWLTSEHNLDTGLVKQHVNSPMCVSVYCMFWGHFLIVHQVRSLLHSNVHSQVVTLQSHLVVSHLYCIALVSYRVSQKLKVWNDNIQGSIFHMDSLKLSLIRLRKLDISSRIRAIFRTVFHFFSDNNIDPWRQFIFEFWPYCKQHMDCCNSKVSFLSENCRFWS